MSEMCRWRVGTGRQAQIVVSPGSARVINGGLWRVTVLPRQSDLAVHDRLAPLDMGCRCY